MNVEVLNTAGIQLSANPSLMLSDDSIALIATIGWGTQGEIKAIFAFDGFRFNQVTPSGFNVTSAAFSNGVYVFINASFKQLPSKVFKFENGVATQVSPEFSVGQFKPLIENGTIVWSELTNPLMDTRKLFVYKNGQVTQLSSTAVNDARLANGKVVWTEGSNGIPSKVMENQNGQTLLVKAASNPIGLDVSGSFISFRENGEIGAAPALTLGAPITAVDLGLSASGKKLIDLSQGDVSVKISQWTSPSYTPGHVGFGFTSGDGLALNGISVQDNNGSVYPLSAWWASVIQPFSWQPVTVHIKKANRKVNVEWWFQG